MTYDLVECGISYRHYLKYPKRSWRCKDCAHDVRKSNRTVPVLIPIRCVRKDHFELVLYINVNTVRYGNVRHRMAKCHGIVR